MGTLLLKAPLLGHCENLHVVDISGISLQTPQCLWSLWANNSQPVRFLVLTLFPRGDVHMTLHELPQVHCAPDPR